MTGLEEVCNGQLGLKWRRGRGIVDDLGSSWVRLEITMQQANYAKSIYINHTTVASMVCYSCGLAVWEMRKTLLLEMIMKILQVCFHWLNNSAATPEKSSTPCSTIALIRHNSAMTSQSDQWHLVLGFSPPGEGLDRKMLANVVAPPLFWIAAWSMPAVACQSEHS